MRIINLQEFRNAVKIFEEASIIDVKCGVGTGSIFTIHFKTVNHEVVYFMVYCPWKFINNDYIVCSWRDSEFSINQTLNSIIDDTIKSIYLNSLGDGLIRLSSGASILVFSDGCLSEEIEIDLQSDYFFQIGDSFYTCLRGLFYNE